MKLTESHRTKFSLTAIFFTFFMDYLSWAIVFPIFAPYFLGANSTAFSSDVTFTTRTTLLGLFLAAFSLGQFFGAPFLGDYADRHGRKKALLVSVFCAVLGLALTAWSMGKDNLVLLFLGRLITGFFASNATICLACIADLSEEKKQRAKYFGYLSLIGGCSFLLGAFLGGKLSDPTFNPLFFPSLPLWVSTGLTLLNCAFILWGFSEKESKHKRIKFDFLHAYKNIKEVLQTKKMKSIYSLYFLFLFGWTILLHFTPVLMVQEFSFTNSRIGDLALFMGVCWAIGSVGLSKVLLAYFAPLKVLEFCLLAFTFFSAFMIYPTHFYATLGVVAGCVMTAGLAWPLCTAMISGAAPNESQGKTLGISQSVQSLATTIAPIAGGLASQLFLGCGFLLGALASLIAAVIYFSLKES